MGQVEPHEVDIQRATADFREASERRPVTSSQTHGANKHFSTQSLVQKRLSIYNWNPGPRRGKKDAFEKQIAGKWHIITLQEVSDYVDHDILTGRRPASTSSSLLNHQCRGGLVFTTGTLGPDEVEKTLSRNKLQESGTS